MSVEFLIRIVDFVCAARRPLRNREPTFQFFSSKCLSGGPIMDGPGRKKKKKYSSNHYKQSIGDMKNEM